MPGSDDAAPAQWAEFSDALREGREPDIDPASFPAIIAHLRKHDPAAYVAAAARLLG